MGAREAWGQGEAWGQWGGLKVRARLTRGAPGKGEGEGEGEANLWRLGGCRGLGGCRSGRGFGLGHGDGPVDLLALDDLLRVRVRVRVRLGAGLGLGLVTTRLGAGLGLGLVMTRLGAGLGFGLVTMTFLSPLVMSPPWLSCANSAFLVRVRVRARVRG